MRKPKTYIFYFYGGPFDGHKAKLESTKTLPFKLGNFYGYYDIKMQWVDLNNG